MTNFEYYKEQIKAIGFNFGIARSGKLLKCSSFPCVDCAFHCNECSEYKFKWLCEEREENKEQPKLTKNERKLCETLNKKCYIARDEDEKLTIYPTQPIKCMSFWYDYSENYIGILNAIFTDCNFSFIKWEDEEPWSVEDLLKLEVME